MRIDLTVIVKGADGPFLSVVCELGPSIGPRVRRSLTSPAQESRLTTAKRLRLAWATTVWVTAA